MTSLPTRDHARVAYDAFAEQYDRFTVHHDYEGWTRTLERLAKAHGLSGDRLLDVACGTGKSFIPFLARGYRVTACDISPSMIERAARKARNAAHLLVHDMRALPQLGQFDLVCCLDDAINYLVTNDELAAALNGMAGNLAQDGVLVFDVNTVRSYRDFFGALTVVPRPDSVVVWRGHTDRRFAAGDLARATTEMLERTGGGDWQRRLAIHHQRHHPREAIEGALDAAGLACAGVYGMQLDGSVEAGFDERHNSKAVYVARRRNRA